MLERFGPARKLCAKDKIILCLIKLRLGHTLQDVANRFKVSLYAESSVFKSEMEGLSAIQRTLIFIPDKKSLVNTNTLKVLISVTPNSFISFLSKAYKGAVIDKKLAL